MTQHTSLDAYHKIQKSIGPKQAKILNLLKKYPVGWTDYMIAQYLKWPINTVTPRRGELCKKGLVVYAGHRVNRDTRMENNTWRAKC